MLGSNPLFWRTFFQNTATKPFPEVHPAWLSSGNSSSLYVTILKWKSISCITWGSQFKSWLGWQRLPFHFLMVVWMRMALRYVAVCQTGLFPFPFPFLSVGPAFVFQVSIPLLVWNKVLVEIAWGLAAGAVLFHEDKVWKLDEDWEGETNGNFATAVEAPCHWERPEHWWVLVEK